MIATTYLTVLAALAGSALAAPIGNSASLADRAAPPADWASGYLEDYQVYHARYLALSCRDHKNATGGKDDFFMECCKPIMATQNFTEVKASWCIPASSSSSSASAYVATATLIDSAVQTEFVEQATSIAEAVSEITATATESLTSVTYTDSASNTATLPVLSETAVPTTSIAEVIVVPTSTTPEPSTSTTYEAPAATTTAASTGGNWNTGGHATYFYQNGNPGACGNWNSDSTPLVALPASWYGGDGGSSSSHCGSYVEIQRVSSGATVTAIVADLCPSCTGNGNSLDLSVGAFNAIASESEGQVDISWKFL